MSQGALGLSVSQAAYLRHHRSEVTEGMPPREVEWSWSEIDVSRSTLVKLRDAGLIEHVDRRTWRASRYLDTVLRGER